jgi:hypothetical protein
VTIFVNPLGRVSSYGWTLVLAPINMLYTAAIDRRLTPYGLVRWRFLRPHST